MILLNRAPKVSCEGLAGPAFCSVYSSTLFLPRYVSRRAGECMFQVVISSACQRLIDHFSHYISVSPICRQCTAMSIIATHQLTTVLTASSWSICMQATLFESATLSYANFTLVSLAWRRSAFFPFSFPFLLANSR